MKIHFKNPPINELVIGTYFNPPLLALRSEHVGLFWSRIRDEFPSVEQQAPVGGAEVFGNLSGEFFPMPRFWFVAENTINLIQLQKNALLLNWRRRDAQYPHFAENLKPTFDKYFRIFEDFVRDELRVDEIKIDLCELAYINAIEACEYWQGPQDTSKVIPSLAIPDAGMKDSALTAFNCTYVYAPSDDLQLSVCIRNGEAKTKPGTPALFLEIRATGRLGQAGKSAAGAWFERAHDAIIDCFVGMTNKDIQNDHWKLVRGIS